MTVPTGTTKRVMPSEATSAHPADPSSVATVMAELPLLYSSTNSSFGPCGPRRRNSLMSICPAPGDCPVDGGEGSGFGLGSGQSGAPHGSVTQTMMGQGSGISLSARDVRSGAATSRSSNVAPQASAKAEREREADLMVFMVETP